MTKSPVKRGVEGVEILCVQAVGGQAERFTEMTHLNKAAGTPFPPRFQAFAYRKKADRILVNNENLPFSVILNPMSSIQLFSRQISFLWSKFNSSIKHRIFQIEFCTFRQMFKLCRNIS